MEDKLIETVKKIYLKTGNPGFILSDMYDILIKRQEIKPFEDNIDTLIKQVESRMYYEALRAGTIGLRDLAKVKSSPGYEKVIMDECKKQVIANYFKLENELDNF